jgi:hypothetical protein
MTTQIENTEVSSEQAANGILKVEKVVETPPAVTIVQQPSVQAPVSPVPVVATTPLVPEPTPVKPAAPALPEVAAIFEKAKAEATTVGRMFLEQIEVYMTEMAPKKPQDVKSISRWQVLLYRTLTSIINKCDTDFFLVWRAVLAAFHAQKNAVFHETAVFRGMQHIVLPPDDVKGFQRLLNLIKATAEPAARTAAIKQIDFSRTLEFGVTEVGRSKLLNFYNV